VLEFEPAAHALSVLVRGIPDELLVRPTPCPAYRLGDLIDHVGGLALAFAAAATKDDLGGSAAPSGDVSRLGDDWRSRIPADLAALARAWRDPAAWTGMTKVGGVELPGEVAGIVALDELVVHGWDVARASAQPFDCDDHLLSAVHDFQMQSSADRPAQGPFGPVVAVPDHAPFLDRVIGLSGRDAGWTVDPMSGK
jgi:uncharacterized protein (TIGR03086 family)